MWHMRADRGLRAIYTMRAVTHRNLQSMKIDQIYSNFLLYRDFASLFLNESKFLNLRILNIFEKILDFQNLETIENLIIKYNNS